jgi:hypothetical protein
MIFKPKLVCSYWWPLVVVFPSDHRHVALGEIGPRESVIETFTAVSSAAARPKAGIDRFISPPGLDTRPGDELYNPMIATSLAARPRGITSVPAYVERLHRRAIICRPLTVGRRERFGQRPWQDQQISGVEMISWQDRRPGLSLPAEIDRSAIEGPVASKTLRTHLV